uniref:Uncharacterized protein n=1 Tax=Rhizophora mucronata TaxID=61149 RepID=A0A2P2ILN6_RHIMU
MGHTCHPKKREKQRKKEKEKAKWNEMKIKRGNKFLHR